MEEWKTINGYENYEVSTAGNVRKKTGKLMTQYDGVGGYLIVRLTKNGKRKWRSVHRLVAIHFIPNPDNLPEVNHINENKTDNSVDNLEWCTRQYNISYGTRGKRVGETRKKKGCCGKKIYCYELDQTFNSIRQASRETGVPHSSIWKCCQGRYKTAGKYHWKYVES